MYANIYIMQILLNRYLYNLKCIDHVYRYLSLNQTRKTYETITQTESFHFFTVSIEYTH